MSQPKRYNTFSDELKRVFGCKVQRISVDAGFTCPNRDGSKGTGGCIYCNNVSFSPKDTQSVIPLEEQLAHGMEYHRQRLHSEKFIVYFQKYTNTYASIDVLADLYRRALAYPDVVGISIVLQQQIFSSMTFCALIKQQFPNIHVTIGGNTVTRLRGFRQEGWRHLVAGFVRKFACKIRAIRDNPASFYSRLYRRNVRFGSGQQHDRRQLERQQVSIGRNQGAPQRLQVGSLRAQSRHAG